MAPIKLWMMQGSPPSWAVMMLSDILGVELEPKEIDFVGLEHKSPEFKKLNPMGTVPVIKDGDFTIAESHTIMKYLLSKYGSKKAESLYPSDIKARALVDQAMFFDTGVVFIKVKLIALPTLFEGLKGMTPQLIELVEENFSIIESYLERSQYIAAAHLTIADLSLGSTVLALNSMYQVDAVKFPRTVAWLRRLEQESFFKKIAVPGAKIIGGLMHSTWEKNKQ